MVTRNLKKSVYDLLSTTGYNVYEFTRVPKSASFPYVTYQIDTSTESLRDSIEDIDFLLIVDILDYREDKNSAIIDAMTDAINTLLNRADVIESDFYYRIDRQSILTTLPTANEHILRRQFNGVLGYIERS